MRFQEMYLPDGDLHSEGGGRMRRFRWNNNGKGQVLIKAKCKRLELQEILILLKI